MEKGRKKKRTQEKECILCHHLDGHRTNPCPIYPLTYYSASNQVQPNVKKYAAPFFSASLFLYLCMHKWMQNNDATHLQQDGRGYIAIIICFCFGSQQYNNDMFYNFNCFIEWCVNAPGSCGFLFFLAVVSLLALCFCADFVCLQSFRHMQRMDGRNCVRWVDASEEYGEWWLDCWFGGQWPGLRWGGAERRMEKCVATFIYFIVYSNGAGTGCLKIISAFKKIGPPVPYSFFIFCHNSK